MSYVIYRVIEVDPVDKGLHTWKVAAIEVERESPRQIKLKSPLPENGGTVFKPDARGRLFFETPLQAIQHFLISQRLRIETFTRRREEAERAVAWAMSQDDARVQEASDSACHNCGDEHDGPCEERRCSECGVEVGSRCSQHPQSPVKRLPARALTPAQKERSR